jgi:hypothetical protein
MRSSQRKSRLLAVLMMVSSLQLNASTPMTGSRLPLSASNIQGQNRIEEKSLLDSLREDVARHPNDFITFETRASANQFITEHGTEAHRETEQRVASRGIFGYWGGKTLVVLPTFSTTTPR